MVARLDGAADLEKEVRKELTKCKTRVATLLQEIDESRTKRDALCDTAHAAVENFSWRSQSELMVDRKDERREA